MSPATGRAQQVLERGSAVAAARDGEGDLQRLDGAVAATHGLGVHDLELVLEGPQLALVALAQLELQVAEPLPGVDLHLADAAVELVGPLVGGLEDSLQLFVPRLESLVLGFQLFDPLGVLGHDGLLSNVVVPRDRSKISFAAEPFPPQTREF